MNRERVASASCICCRYSLYSTITYTLHSIPYTLTLSLSLFGVAGSRWLPQTNRGFLPIHYGTVLHCTALYTGAVLHCAANCTLLHCNCTFLPLYLPHSTAAGTIRYNALQRTSVRFCRTVLYRCRTVTLASSLTPTLGRWLISIPSHTRLDQALPAPRFLPTKPVTLHIVYTSPRSS